MNPPVYGGIDAGLFGALAVIDGDHVRVWDTPIIAVAKAKGGEKNVYDEPAMLALLQQAKAAFGAGREVHIALEQFQPRPGQASTSTGIMGVGWGLWRMALQAAGVTFHPVAAATWSARIFTGTGLIVPKKGTMPEAARDRVRKNNSRILATRLFPQDAHLFARVKDHGRAESALIARYLYGAHR